VPQGDESGPGSVGHTQLFEDGADVIADRAFGKIQLVRDFGVRQAAREEAENIALTLAEGARQRRIAGDSRIGDLG